MTYDISFLWIWLLLALVVGLAVGWNSWTWGPQAPWFRGWFRWSLIAFVVGLLVAWTHWLSGRLGFWLETALLFYVVYVVGCLVAGVARRLVSSEPIAAPAGLAAAVPSPFVAAASPPPSAPAPVASVAPALEEPAKPPGYVGFAAASPTPARAEGASPPVAPASEAPHVHRHFHPGDRPPGLSAARDGRPDALELIGGLSASQAGRLHALGVWHYDQIAAWTSANSEWVSHHLGYAGEVEREDWPGQARALVSGAGAPPAAAAAPAAVAAPTHPEPAAMGPVEGEEKHGGARPPGLVSPRGGVADDLKRIRGIGPQNERRLHALGVWHFAQIAEWSPDNVHWVGSYLAFPGRIDREAWIAQAKVLASGGATEFSHRVERGEVASSRDDGDHGQHNVADLSAVKRH